MSAAIGAHRDDGEPDLNALAALGDGRLSSAERADLTAHLAACPQCRAIVAELARGAAPAVRSWTTVLGAAASIAAVVIGGSMYLRVHQAEPPAAVLPPVVRPTTPVISAPKPSTSSQPAAPASPVRPPDRTRAAGTTSVHGKTFHLVAGEWTDDAYRERDFLPVVEVSSRPQLDATAALRPYAALGSRFVVVIHGTVYRVSIP
jgi:anti-sigma factor RsiW